MAEQVMPAEVQGGTEEQARGYLAARGYPPAEAEWVLEQARKFPGRYEYARPDRYAWAVKHMPGGTWCAGDSTETERRITALGTAARNGWRLVP